MLTAPDAWSQAAVPEIDCTGTFPPAITCVPGPKCGEGTLSVSRADLTFDGIDDHVVINNNLSTADSFTFEALEEMVGRPALAC